MIGKLLFFSILVGFSQGASLPQFLRRCSRSDLDFNPCLLNTIRDNYQKIVAGDFQQFGIPPLNPLKLGSAIVKGSGGLVHETLETEIVGIEKANIEDFKIDFDKKIITLAATVDKLVCTSRYKASGKVLSFQIAGDGIQKTYMDKLNVSYKMNFIFKKDSEGNDHMFVKSVDNKYKLEKVQFDITGLINEEIGKVFVRVVNENWKEIWDDMGSAGMDIFTKKIVNVMNNIYSKYSVDELFLP